MVSSGAGAFWEWPRAGAAGAAAGLAAFAIDDLLANIMLGYWLPIHGEYLLGYLCTGVAMGLVVTAVARVLFGLWLSGWVSIGATMASIYALPLLERVLSTTSHLLGTAPALALSVLVVLAYGGWVVLLTRWVPVERRFWPLMAAAATAALGLAMNRNLVDLPTAPAALAADAGLLTGGTVVAVIVRWINPRVPALILGGLGVAAAAWAALPESISCTSDRPVGVSQPPNLVLVIIDTLRQDVFQEVVNETEEGQALGRILNDAAWFDNAIAASPWTPPSVGSILTGLYPEEHGFGRKVRDPSRPLQPLAPSVTTMAELLADRGYLTAALVTNALLHPHSGMSRGFEHYVMAAPGSAKLPLLGALNRILPNRRRTQYLEAADMRRLFSRRLGWLTENDCPIFLWLHLMDPHQPLHHHRDLPPDAAARELPERDRLYREEVRYVLREVALTIELLQSHGLWDTSVVVLVSDHGEMSVSDKHDSGVMRAGEPILDGHGHALYEELVHVPLVIRPPGGLPDGRRVSAMASHVDLFATCLDLLGVDAPSTGVDRVSLAPWLTAEPVPDGTALRPAAIIGGIQRGPRHWALRTSRHKLILYPHSQRPTQLFDLVRDPDEQHNRASEQERRAAALEQQLRRLRKSWITPLAQRQDAVDPTARERLEALGYLE